jgi:iron complex transport system ATP-binding protein
MTTPVRLTAVGVVRDGVTILSDIDWAIGAGESWALLGPNGSGKTTLARLISMYDHPTSGTVEVLGERLGATDVRSLRRRIGLVSPALADQLRPTLTAEEVVVCALNAALEPWWHDYSDADRRNARARLDEAGAGALGSRTFGALSSGERQRVLIARQLMTGPDLIIFDEPTAGLDLAAREQLVGEIGRLAADERPTILVTHHPEEIPATFTHALLLKDGRVLEAGRIGDTISAQSLSDCFGIELDVERIDGRWWARSRHG